MPAATGKRHLETPEDEADFRRWRLGFFVFLTCAIFAALSAFVLQQQTSVLIRPTGPLPAVNVP